MILFIASSSAYHHVYNNRIYLNCNLDKTIKFSHVITLAASDKIYYTIIMLKFSDSMNYSEPIQIGMYPTRYAYN